MAVKPPAGAIEDSAAFAEAHQRLLADRSIQFELKAFEPPQPPAWLEGLIRFLSDIFPVLRVLFWMLLAAIVLFILYAIARRFSGADWPWRRRVKAETGEQNWRPAAEPARRLLQDADALAARGEYSEAAHLLLFRSIEDIDSRRPALVRPALTSRDIAGLPAIPSGPRGAFGRIVTAVERSLFAKRPLGPEDWRDCRSAYEEFAFVEAWRG